MSFLYRALLRACPADLREGYGDEMASLARHCVEVEAARRGRFGRAWAEMRALADLAMFAINARLGAFDSDARQSPRQPLFSRGHMMRDIRSALRQMRARPLFAATVVLMLALGIGATAAIFSVVNGVLLTLQLPHPDRIVEISGAFPERSIDTVSWSEANTWDLIDRTRSFSAIGSEHPATFSVTGDGAEPERVQASRVSVGFLRALAVAPVAGRIFVDGEDAPGAIAERVVISERLWTRRFGRDPKIVGRSIAIDGTPYDVIGVVPGGPVWLDTSDVFVPFRRRANGNRGSWEWSMIGRLAPGATMASAKADLDVVMAHLQQYPDNKGIVATVNGVEAWMASPELRRTLWVMLGSVFLLLVIASVNVTNLLFVRASARARERAVRTALGASRADLIRESLAESMLFSLIAAIAGWGIAAAMLATFKAQDPGGIPRLSIVEINGVVLAFAFGVAMLVGLATGLMPALRTPFGQIVTALREGQRGSVGDRRQERTRAAFVALEVAVSVLLLVGAALLVRSLHNVLNSERGFATDGRLTAEISIPGAYPAAKRTAIAKQIIADVQALPGMQSVATVSGAILVGGGTGMNFAAAGSSRTPENAPWATWRIVTPSYFETIGLTFMAGRNFIEHDKIGKPWRVIISDRLAKQIWPNDNPIGKMCVLWAGQSNDLSEVVGVVSDMREHRLDDAPTLSVYFPTDDDMMASTTLRLVMHTSGKADAAAPALRAAVKRVDPSLPISRVQSIETLVAASVSTRRFTMKLLGIFAGIAALLALAGVAGVLAYTMSHRRNEMGLRLALGARRAQLLAMAMRVGLLPVVIGLVAGLAMAAWLSQLLTSLLYGVQASDPMTYVEVATALLSAAALACYVPARTVTNVDPASVMRAD